MHTGTQFLDRALFEEKDNRLVKLAVAGQSLIDSRCNMHEKGEPQYDITWAASSVLIRRSLNASATVDQQYQSRCVGCKYLAYAKATITTRCTC